MEKSKSDVHICKLFRIRKIWRDCHYADRWANPKLEKIELKNDLIIAIKLHIHLPGCLMNCKRHYLLFLYHAWLTLFMITSRLIQPSLIHYCKGNRGHLDSQWQLFRDRQLELKWLISVYSSHVKNTKCSIPHLISLILFYIRFLAPPIHWRIHTLFSHTITLGTI